MLVVVAARPDDELDRDQLIAGLRRWRTRARHLAEENKRLLDKNATWRTRAAALENRVVELEAELTAANEKIATLTNLCFGTKSERKRTTAASDG